MYLRTEKNKDALSLPATTKLCFATKTNFKVNEDHSAA